MLQKIGFYPVVDSYQWIEKLIPLGVPSIQLRIKNQPIATIDAQIIASQQLATHYNCQLFINDYWELAIKHHAFGVHLGQEDCDAADFQAIHRAGLKLGISTHNDHEINRALQFDPHYLAYGPIYETTTKVMQASPRGINRLTYWVNAINLPIVAIGGITLENLDDVVKTGVEGIAVVSAITQATDYQHTVEQFMRQISSAVTA